MQDLLAFLDDLHWTPAEPLYYDGELHRYKIVGDKDADCSYRLWETGGWIRNHKEGRTVSWQPSNKSISPSDRARYIAKQKEIKAEVAAAKKKAAKEAVKIYNEAEPASRSHPYLSRKLVSVYNAKQIGNRLVIPAYGEDGNIKTLQYIDDEGNKLFLEGGEASGAYNILGDDTSCIIIAEGFATAASIYEATGKTTVMAFSASNVPKVTKLMHTMYPTAKLIVACDNDKYKDFNAGVSYAMQVKDIAELRPVQFAAGVKGKPTDYNDLYLLEGLDAVSNQLFPPPVNDDIFGDHTPQEENTKRDVNLRQPFRVLGFNDGVYYYYPEGTQQIIELQPAAHTAANLLQLAKLEYWMTQYGDKGKIDYTEVADDLMEQAHSQGIFNPATQIRRRGVWQDGGKTIFNSGEYLYIDGVEQVALKSLRDSKYIYVRAERLPPPLPPLSNPAAHKFREICEMANWRNKVSGTLLAGWCVVSLVSGSLNWRPHIWLTGESGSGKTTILREIIGRVLRDMALEVDGGTTEAALRQVIGGDSLPVIYDEAESESDKDKIIMEGVLLLARKASSGAALIKGGATGQPSYHYCKSTFCFSCINPAMRKFADERRVVMLELMKSSDDVNYQDFLDAIRETLTPDFGRQLLGRAITYLPTLLKNGQIFVDAATKILGDRAAADQLGNILAGVYLLHSTKEVTYEAAKNFLQEHDLRSYTTIDEHKDAERLLSFITSRRYRVNQYHEHYIGELINDWYKDHTKTGLSQSTIEDSLRQLGIWPKLEGVWISNNSPWLDEILKATHWAKWKVLSRLEGVTQTDPTIYAAGQKGSRGICIPKSYFFS